MADSFLQTALSQLGRAPREFSRNIADLVKTYGPAAAETGVQMLPGAGLVQAPQDYGNAARAFGQGNYGQAALYGLQGLYNQGSEMIPGGAALPTMTLAGAMVPAAAREAGAGTRLVGPGEMPLEVPGSGLADYRVAQRVPTVKGTPADIGATQDLRINMDTMRQDPAYWEKVTNNPLRGIVPEKTMRSADPEERAGAGLEIMTSNLRRLYEAQDPAVRERAGFWYPGGNKIATRMGEEIGVPTRSVAGAIAALSPGTDWFKNVDQARRLVETYGENPILSRSMIDQFRDRASGGLTSYADDLDKYVGTRWSDIPDDDAAVAAWAHDFATRPRDYQVLSPEGMQTGQQLTKAGKPESTIWQSRENVAKAVRSLRSGGDMGVISDAAGKAHKVRNFYNNIIAPSRAYDDYTSDTHNIAGALLQPLGQKDEMVAVGLGNAGPKSGPMGAKGLYGMYADAGRQLAREYGVAPFQVQSPTWEGVRALFPANAKNETNKAEVGKIWQAFRQGDIGLTEAQDRVFDYAQKRMGGDINRVPWR